MRFIELPIEVYSSIPEETRIKMGIDSPRKNAYGTKVIMHVEHYEALFPSVSTMNESESSSEVMEYPFPVYDSPSEELDNLLNSPEWSPENEPEQ